MTNPYWDFKKPNPKYGYVNNPFQADEAEHTNKHHPCGYWPVGAPLSTSTKPIGGTLFGSGYNSVYQLGIGDDNERLIFTQITNSTYYKKVSTGLYCTFAITNNGEMWGIGANLNGALGLGDINPRTAWEQIPGVWKEVSTSYGDNWSVAIKEDGTLWVTGRNQYGQLGLNDEIDRNTWEQVGTASNWVSVETGRTHLMALNSDGELYSCGYNYPGALGLGDGTKRKELEGATTGVAKVVCGFIYTGIIKTDGSVWMTGSNSSGQFGNGTTTDTNSFVEITSAGKDNAFIECGGGDSAGDGTTFLIKNSGIMWATGYNGENEMGVADTSNKLDYIQLDGTNWESVANKARSTLAIKTNGEMYGAGWNAYGELGFGDKVQRTAFERVGSKLWMAVDAGDKNMMAINWAGTYDWG